MKKIINGVQCWITYPKDFDERKKYPLIIMLNGAGSRGSDIAIVQDSTILEYQNTHDDFPFVVLSPLCEENTWFDMFERLKGCVEQSLELPFVDKSHVYLTGASMGGYASWQMLMSLPDVFAAAMICCGGGMYWNAGRIKTPVWAFHGRKDPTVYVEETEKMIKAVKSYGIETRETYYDDVAHNCWLGAYTTKEVYEWFLAHEKI